MSNDSELDNKTKVLFVDYRVIMDVYKSYMDISPYEIEGIFADSLAEVIMKYKRELDTFDRIIIYDMTPIYDRDELGTNMEEIPQSILDLAGERDGLELAYRLIKNFNVPAENITILSMGDLPNNITNLQIYEGVNFEQKPMSIASLHRILGLEQPSDEFKSFFVELPYDLTSNVSTGYEHLIAQS